MVWYNLGTSRGMLGVTMYTKDEYNAEFNIKPSKLYKEELYDLESFIKQHVNITKENDFSISLNLQNRDITAYSMDELYSKKLPQWIDNINIDAKGREKTESYSPPIQSIHIRLFNNYSNKSYVKTEGENRVWVEGINKILSDYFKDKRTWYANFHFLHLLYPSLLILLSFGTIITNFILALDNYITLILPIILLTVSTLSFPKINKRIFPYLKINHQPKPKKGKFSKEGKISIFITIIIGVLSILIPQLL